MVGAYYEGPTALQDDASAFCHKERELVSRDSIDFLAYGLVPPRTQYFNPVIYGTNNLNQTNPITCYY